MLPCPKTSFTADMSAPAEIANDAVVCRKQCTILAKATESEDERNELQVVENEQYFIILPIGCKAKSSRILNYFSYQTVSGQLPKPTLLTR